MSESGNQASSENHSKPSRGRRNRKGGRGRGGYTYVRKKKESNQQEVESKKEDSLPATSTSFVKKKKKKNTQQQKETTTEQATTMIQQLRRGNYECLVCFDRIGKKAGIWNCESCFTIFHIGCIHKWSKSSSEGDQNLWACPACRSEVQGKAKPLCFCGKTYKPAFDPFLVPHSCGEPCHRERKGTTCPHKCTQICHPGSCPPCPALGEKKNCFCGKTVYQLRCGENDEGRTCGDVCGRLLNCKMHRCKEICHDGDCKPCNIPMQRSCYCGKQRKALLCGEGALSIVGDDIGYFQCDDPCERKLSCENHFCMEKCHPGYCKKCATGTHLKTCPCGAFMLDKLISQPRTSCSDPIPVCHSVCERLLPCSHRCNELCHLGECKECQKTSTVTCRCGKTQQTVRCSELYEPGTTKPREILCNNTCKKHRSCGRHKCNTVCCPVAQFGTSAHPCPRTCDKPLNCGNHICKKECHRGPCDPCLNASFDELSCECGKTIIYPPVPCGTAPPECSHPCSRPHACDHPVLHPCHNEPECPKCYSLVTRACGCGKKLMTTKCFVQFPCCGDLCKKPLRCGLHYCNRPCHGGPCQDESILEGESCGLPCNADILTCSHRCAALCHPGEPCPIVQCQEAVTLRCPCGNNTSSGICLHGGNSEFNNDNYIRLECNDMCALKARQKQLANAFGRAEDLSDVVPTYPITLTNAAVSVPKFVKHVEEVFCRLIQSEDRTYQFPPMNSFYRSVIHQLAEFYKLEAVSYDEEPNRNVAVTKTSQSAIPFVTLCDLVSRHPIPRQPGTGDGINKEGKPAGILFYDLKSSILSEHIHRALRFYRGHYFLKWIDDTSAVAMFNDEKTMKVAAYNISNNPYLKSSPILESDYSQIFATKAKKKNPHKFGQRVISNEDMDENENGEESEERDISDVLAKDENIHDSEKNENSPSSEDVPECWADMVSDEEEEHIDIQCTGFNDEQ